MFHSAVKQHDAGISRQNSYSQQSVLAGSSQDIKSVKQNGFDESKLGNNILRPAGPDKLNIASKASNVQQLNAGVKRSFTDLKKAFGEKDGFDVGPNKRQQMNSDAKSTLNRPTNTIVINDDDFDSDIDLDIEDPISKGLLMSGRKKMTPGYRNQAISPTLPRQQITSKSSSLIQEHDSRYGPSPRSSEQIKGLSSQTKPILWSSSPSDHRQTPRASNPQTSVQTIGTRHNSSMSQPLKEENKVVKRQKLPWMVVDQSDSQMKQNGPPPPPPPQSNQASGTPNTKSSQYMWNMTASAVKGQQKTLREENKKKSKFAEAEIAASEMLSKTKTSNVRVPRIFLSEEQQHVMDLAVEKTQSVFFTGSAGTGKSVLLREIIAVLRRKYIKESDRVAVTASTGLAACNIGGVTLHSFAGIGLGKEDVTELIKKIKRNQKAKQRWLRTKILVIDEVSMVDGDLMDKLEAIARQIRHNGRPFGGIQLIITGDFFQLPPVPEGGRAAKFAFDASSWATSIQHTIGLHQVFRQKDPIFAGMLNEMREGRLSQSSIDAFQQLDRPLDDSQATMATELFPTRNEVETANTSRMNQLVGDVKTYEARDGGTTDKVQRDRLLQSCMAAETLHLKKGAQVMLIKNIDESLVNGSVGQVIGFMTNTMFESYNNNNDDDLFKSSLPQASITTKDPAQLRIEAARNRIYENSIGSTSQLWPMVRFQLAEGTTRDLLCQRESWTIELPNGEVQASRSQIPLILAWALSIHKAQGQTLERVRVDLGKVFEKGQAYVALSRATNMAGLQVLRFDPKKVVAHERVRSFYAQLSRVELAESSRKKPMQV